MRFCALMVGSYIVLFLFDAYPRVVHAGENTWTTDGPYGASVRTIAVHPANPDIVLLGTIQHGIYKSTDAGEGWRHIESPVLPRNHREIAFHPTAPDTVYAATAYGVYGSNDCGETWADISPPGRAGEEFRAIALDPLHPSNVITGGAFDRWKSTDGGRNWMEFAIDPEWPGGPDHEVDALAIDPVNTSIVYLVTADAEFGRGIYRSTDGGDNWICIHNDSDSSGFGTDVAVDPADVNTLYYSRHDYQMVSGGRFLSKSTDGGASWTDISPTGLNVWGVKAIQVSPRDHNLVYVATVNDGIRKSTDGGASWAPADSGLNSKVCASLAADSAAGALYLGLYGDGIYKSTDGGGSWRRISQNLLGAGTYDLAFAGDPISGSFVVGGLGCHFQLGEGTPWVRVATGIPVENRPGAIEADRSDPANVYIATFYPYPLSPPPEPCGLQASTDGGATWALRRDGLPADQGFQGLAVSHGPGGVRRIFLGAAFESLASSGIYYSDDLGQSWQRSSGGLPAQAYTLLAAARGESGVLAAADGHNRVYVTADRGANWIQATALPRRYDESIIDLQFDPHSDSVLFASSSYYGLYRSSDLGRTWGNITHDLPVDSYGAIIYGPAINPYNPANMFVSSAHHGVYETHDGGNHWISFNTGLDTARSFGPIFFAPGDTSRLYMAALSVGVWSIHRTVTGVGDEGSNLPGSFALYAYPNPFNSRTTIGFHLQRSSNVSLNVFDIQGRWVAQLASGPQAAGDHRLAWGRKEMSSGIYFIRLRADGHDQVLKITLLK